MLLPIHFHSISFLGKAPTSPNPPSLPRRPAPLLGQHNMTLPKNHHHNHTSDRSATVSPPPPHSSPGPFEVLACRGPYVHRRLCQTPRLAPSDVFLPQLVPSDPPSKIIIETDKPYQELRRTIAPTAEERKDDNPLLGGA